MAEVCLEKNITLVHISTDFVFNGNSQSPYKEGDTTDPISVYGQTKLDGEKAIQNILSNYFIIRTSWLYSQFGHNFVKSMLHLSKNRDELSIVDNQIGTPTYALDLAQVLCKLMNDNSHFGLYHYSNLGDVSWYDFAKAIFERTENRIKVYPIPSSSYPTPATRPNYSVLDKGKIAKTLNLKIPYWQESLDKCLKGLF